MRVDFGFKDVDRGWDAIKQIIENSRDRDVKVGVQADAGSAMVTVASANEYGTDKIPARSFIRAAIDKSASELSKAAAELGRRVIDRSTTQDNALGLLGLLAQKRIVEEIRSGVPPPNAASTVKAKGSSATLIDTGALRQSIRHKISDRSEA